jgi:hypothetical protein
LNWFLNGIPLKQTQKYSIVKQKEIAIIQINRISQNECGIYAVQAMGKTAPQLATLNIES